MKKLLFLPLLSALIISGWAQNPPSFSVENLMKAEGEAGFPVRKKHFKRWEHVRQTINRKIEFPSSPTRQEALQICKEMYQVLVNNLDLTYEISYVMSRSLSDSTLDCNLYSIIYYDILNKQHGYSVYPVVTPGHMFIRWHYSEKNHINYETTEDTIWSDSRYISFFGVSEQAMNNELYMSELNERELWATCYVEMANAQPDTAYKSRRRLCNQSLALDSHCVFAQITKGLLFAQQSRYDSSLTYFHQLLSLDTSNYSIANSLGEVYALKKEHEKAVHYYGKAISINPHDPQLYIDRSYEYLRVDNVEAAMSDFKQAAAQLKKENIFEFLFNYQHLKQLEENIMEAYVNQHSE